MSDSTASLDVVVDSSGAEQGAARVKRSFDGVSRSSKRMTSNITDADIALGDLKSVMKNLSAETDVAARELESLSRKSNFNDLESARKSLGALHDLRETIDSLSDGLNEAQQMMKDFKSSYGDTGIFKTKSAQNMLKEMQKELDATGKSLDKLRKGADGAIDSATKKIAGMEAKLTSGASNILRSIKNVVAAYMSFRTVTSYLNKVVAETTEQERATQQLEARLRSTQYAAGLTSEELQSMAERLQGLSTYSNDAILGMESILLTFKNIKGDTFEDAAEAVLDISTALGRDLQSTALQVGKALQDPIRGVSNLREVGIQFSSAQEEMIKKMTQAGDVAGAQAVMLKELESQFGGSAEAARNGLGGALAVLRNNFDELFEMNASSEFDKVTESVNTLADTLRKPKIQKFRDDILDLTANGIEIMNKALVALADNLEAVKALVEAGFMYKLGSMLGGPLGGIVGVGAGALGRSMYNQWQTGKENRNMTAELGGWDVVAALPEGVSIREAWEEKILKPANKILEQEIADMNRKHGSGRSTIQPSAYEVNLGNTSKSTQKQGKSPVEQLVESIRDQIKYLYADGESFLPVIDQWIAKSQVLGKDWKALKDLRREITDRAAEINPLAPANVLENLKETKSRMADLREEAARLRQAEYDNYAWQNGAGLMTDGEYMDKAIENFERLKTEFAATGAAVENFLLWPPELQSAFSTMQTAIEQNANTALESLKKQLDDGKISADEYKKSALDLVNVFVSEGLSAGNAQTFFKQITKDAGDAKNKFIDLNAVTTDWITKFQDGVADAIVSGENLGDVLSGIGEELLKLSLKSALFGQDGKGGMFGGVFSWIGGLFGSAKGNVFGPTGHIAKYAKGGVPGLPPLSDYVNSIVSRPTLFAFAHGAGLMGEGKGPEAIMPLTRTASGELGVKALGASGGEAPSVVINIENRSGTDVEAQQTSSSFDGENWVIGVVMNAIQTNKRGMRTMLKGARA